jgi:hypothetical protein
MPGHLAAAFGRGLGHSSLMGIELGIGSTVLSMQDAPGVVRNDGYGGRAAPSASGRRVS